MNPRLAVRAAALLTLAFAAAAPAQAFRTSGTFSGTSVVTPLPLPHTPPRPLSYYDGAPITGEFEVYAPDPVFHQGDTTGAYFRNGSGGFLSMTFQIRDDRFTIYQGDVDESTGNFPSIIQMQAGGQEVHFQTDFRPRYGGGILTFSAGATPLFSGLDPSTLHIDPAAPPTVSVYFADSTANMTVGFVARELTFNLAAPVPEAPAVPMMLSGLALVAWAARRR